jgi:hypothetical protein
MRPDGWKAEAEEWIKGNVEVLKNRNAFGSL